MRSLPAGEIPAANGEGWKSEVFLIHCAGFSKTGNCRGFDCCLHLLLRIIGRPSKVLISRKKTQNTKGNQRRPLNLGAISATLLPAVWLTRSLCSFFKLQQVIEFPNLSPICFKKSVFLDFVFSLLFRNPHAYRWPRPFICFLKL